LWEISACLVKEWLRVTGPGYYIPFHDVFASAVPRLEDRQRILKTISLTPGRFVDIESGRIDRYSTNHWRRLLSLGMVLAAIGIATGIVAAACFLSVPDWPLTSTISPRY
jgi:hypothetical protein